MAITFDPRKRDLTLADRGLDFATADEVFAGDALDIRIVGGTTARTAWSASVSCVAAW